MAETLQEWLEQAGLVEIYDRLVAEDIDLGLLMELDDADMRALGLSLGRRKRLRRAIRARRAGAGAAATRPAPEEWSGAPERRRLTVMFIDLVGSTALSASLDVEDFRSVISAYQKCCSQIVERHGGMLAKYMGDGVLAYFGYPQATEHAAENSVRAGLEIIDSVHALHPLPDLNLSVRIGAATGTAIVGDRIGTGGSAEDQVVGDTPNLAARLQAAAEPGSMMISKATRDLVGPLFVYRENRGVRVKGFDISMTCYSVLAEREVDNRFRAKREDDQLAPLEGRNAELDALMTMWRDACDGHEVGALILADAGFGKSRLLVALEQHVAAGPYHVVNLSCQPQFSNSTLHPVRTFITRHAHFNRHDAPSDRYVKLTRLLEAHGMIDKAPLFAAMLEIPAGGVYVPPEETPQRRRQSFFQAMAELMRKMGRGGPLLVTIEDLHWADATTLEFLQALPDALAETSTLIVATARPGVKCAYAADRRVRTIELDRLSDEAVGALARHVSGGRELAPELIDRIRRQAEGNPLFVEELTKTLLESEGVREVDGKITLDAGAVGGEIPATLHDSLMARLDRLADAKLYAQIASAIGREFPLHLLVEVCRRPAEAVLDGMVRVEDAEIVFPYEVAGERHWSFKHALIQEAAYESQLRGHRRDLHGSIAAAMERVMPEEVTQHPEIMAHHLSRAGQHSRAIEFGCAAGMGALVRSANAEAVAHTRACLEWLGSLDEGPERDLLEMRVIALRTPAIMQHQGYTSPEIETLERRLLDLLDRLGDRPEAFPSILGLKVFHHVRSERRRARELAERFLALAERIEDSSNLVAGLPMLGQCSWIEGKHAEAEELLRRGIELYDLGAHRTHGAQYGFDTLSYCRMTLSQVLWITGRDTEALQEAQAALDHARAINHTNTIGLALLYVIMLHQQRGERDAAARLAGEALAYCDRMGVSTPTSYIALIANWAAGDVDGSVKLFGIHDALGAHLGLTYYRSLAVENCIEAGDMARASEVLAPALEQAETTGERYWLPRLLALKARIALALGNGDAVKLLKESAAWARADGAYMLEAMALNDLREVLPAEDAEDCSARLADLMGLHNVEVSDHRKFAGLAPVRAH